MSQRRVFVRESDKVYSLIGLVESSDFVTEVTDAEGCAFTLAHVTPHYVIYAPAVIEMEPDPEMPDAWKPFVEHGTPPWPAQP